MINNTLAVYFLPTPPPSPNAHLKTLKIGLEAFFPENEIIKWKFFIKN